MSIPRLALPLLLGLFLVLLAAGLSDPELTGIDECRSGVVVRDMVEGGHWLLPRTPDGFLSEKPPGYYGSCALLSLVFGTHEWTMRAVSVIAALGTLALAWFLARLYGSPRAATIALLALAANVCFAAWARRAMVDMLLTFFVTAGLSAYFAVRCGKLRPFAGAWLSGTAFGLAILTKGPLGMALPIAVIVADLLIPVRGRVRKLSLPWMPVSLSVLLATALALTWYLPGYLKGGSEFLHTCLLDENFYMPLGMSRGIAGSHNRGLAFYPLLQAEAFLPVVMLIPATLRWCFRKEPAAGRLPMATWFIVGFCLFMAASNKRQYYLLPIQPPIAVLIGLAVDHALLDESSRLLRRSALAIGALLVGIGLVGSFVALSSHVPALVVDSRATALTFLGLILAAGIYLLRAHGPVQIVRATLLCSLLAVAVRSLVIDPAEARFDRARPGTAALLEKVPRDTPVAVHGTLHGYGLDFYWPTKLRRGDSDWAFVQRSQAGEMPAGFEWVGEIQGSSRDRDTLLLRRKR